MRMPSVWRMASGLCQDFVSVPVLESSFAVFCIECLMFFITTPVTLSVVLLVMCVLQFLPHRPRLLVWRFLMMPFFHFFYFIAKIMQTIATTPARRDNYTGVLERLSDIMAKD